MSKTNGVKINNGVFKICEIKSIIKGRYVIFSGFSIGIQFFFLGLVNDIIDIKKNL